MKLGQNKQVAYVKESQAGMDGQILFREIVSGGDQVGQQAPARLGHHYYFVADTITMK